MAATRGAARADHESRLPARARAPCRRSRRSCDAHPDVRHRRSADSRPRRSVQGSARGDPDMLTGLFGRTAVAARLLPRLAVSRRNVVSNVAIGNGHASVTVDWVSGACMLARRDAFERSAASTSATSCTGKTPTCAGGCGRAATTSDMCPARRRSIVSATRAARRAVRRSARSTTAPISTTRRTWHPERCTRSASSRARCCPRGAGCTCGSGPAEAGPTTAGPAEATAPTTAGCAISCPSGTAGTAPRHSRP